MVDVPWRTPSVTVGGDLFAIAVPVVILPRSISGEEECAPVLRARERTISIIGNQVGIFSYCSVGAFVVIGDFVPTVMQDEVDSGVHIQHIRATRIIGSWSGCVWSLRAPSTPFTRLDK